MKYSITTLALLCVLTPVPGSAQAGQRPVLSGETIAAGAGCLFRFIGSESLAALGNDWAGK